MNNIELANKIKMLMSDAESSGDVNEALALHFDNKFSKSQYNNTRQFSLNRRSAIFRSYSQLQKAKTECRPSGTEIVPSTASVSVQLAEPAEEEGQLIDENLYGDDDFELFAEDDDD